MQAEVARLLELAYAGIYDERYHRTVEACDRILRVDPGYGVALELRILAQRLCHMTPADYGSIYRFIEPWVVRTGIAAIPCPETFRVPSPEEWAKVDLNATPELEAIRRELDLGRILIDLKSVPYEDALATIREVTGLNLILAAEIVDRIRIDPPVSIVGRGLSPREAIARIMNQVSPAHRIDVTEEGAVMVSRKFPPGYPTGAEPIATETFSGASFGGPITDPGPNGFSAVLEATRVDLDVQNWPLTAIIDDLRTRTGLDLRISDSLDILMVSLKASQESLRSVLNRLLEPRSMTYAIEGVTIQVLTK